MSGTIQTNTDAAGELATTVTNSLEGYLGFSLSVIAGDATVSGSADHDGLQSSINAALSTWRELITSDAKALVDADAAFSSQDSIIAQVLLGVGSE